MTTLRQTHLCWEGIIAFVVFHTALEIVYPIAIGISQTISGEYIRKAKETRDLHFGFGILTYSCRGCLKATKISNFVQIETLLADIRYSINTELS